MLGTFTPANEKKISQAILIDTHSAHRRLCEQQGDAFRRLDIISPAVKSQVSRSGVGQLTAGHDVTARLPLTRLQSDPLPSPPSEEASLSPASTGKSVTVNLKDNVELELFRPVLLFRAGSRYVEAEAVTEGSETGADSSEASAGTDGSGAVLRHRSKSRLRVIRGRAPGLVTWDS